MMITLTTDFGLDDPYVGVMKGVMLSIAPEAQLVDLSHAVPAQDVRTAAYVVYAAQPYFPKGTVHLAVIDPGVGTERLPIAIQTAQALFVGPDNGLFTYVMEDAAHWKATTLSNPEYHLAHVSKVFHGRDIFAPAAAHLSIGLDLDRLGDPVENPVRLPLPYLVPGRQELKGEVLHIDRFGNVVTSVGRLRWNGEDLILDPAFRADPAHEIRFASHTATVEIAGRTVHGIQPTYGTVEIGEMMALVGSTGFLELAVRQGSAARRLDVRPGAAVIVRT
jgi:hypothetical protein